MLKHAQDLGETPSVDTLVFFSAIDPRPESSFALRTLPERFRSDFPIQQSRAKNFFCPDLELFPTLHQNLIQLNSIQDGGGSGVFFTVNETDGLGFAAKNIIRVRACFVELDCGTLTGPVLKTIVENYSPSIIVESSPGKAHIYWLTELPTAQKYSQEIFPLKHFTTIQEILQHIFSAYDAGIQSKDLPRVLRVPGYLHLKDPKSPKDVQLLYANPEVRYTLDSLLDTLKVTPEMVAEVRAKASKRKSISQVVSDDGIYEGANEGGRNDLFYSYVLNHLFLNRGLNPEEALGVAALTNRKNKPPLYPQEVEQIVASAYKRFIEVHDGRHKLSPGQAKEVFNPWTVEGAVIQPKENVAYFDPDFQYEYSLADFASPISDTSIVERVVQRYKPFLLHNKELGLHLYEGTRWVNEMTPGVDVHAKLATLLTPVLSSVGLEPIVIDSFVNGKGVLSITAVTNYRKSLGSAAMYNNMIRLLEKRDDLYSDPALFDAVPTLLGSPKGIINLEANPTLLAHDPTYRISKQISIPYSEEAKCPVFDKFLDEFTCGNQALAKYLLRVLGYCLSGEVSEQVLFFFYGSGANGKSRFCELMYDLLGSEYATYVQAELIVRKKVRTQAEQASPYLMSLRGKRVAILMEIEEGYEWGEAIVKDLTSDEPIVARGLHRDPITFRPTAKLVIRTNHMPKVGSGDGIWRRLHTIPCSMKVKNKDPHLKNKLMRELPGILNAAILGYRDWLNQGLNPPMVIKEAKRLYQLAESPLRFFISSCTIESDFTEEEAPKLQTGSGASSQELFASWNIWKSENEENISPGHEYHSLSQFSCALRSAGYDKSIRQKIDGVKHRRFPLYLMKKEHWKD